MGKEYRCKICDTQMVLSNEINNISSTGASGELYSDHHSTRTTFTLNTTASSDPNVSAGTSGEAGENTRIIKRYKCPKCGNEIDVLKGKF
ncbi:MAG: hypothetical protein NTW65_13425 [Deltaproteobacteria bacterium]|nr:hypothetical protein [Deltaproteobacteria bacterium]